MSDLSGKAALVSGASRGIGRAIALGLAERGAAVCCLARNTTELQKTVEQIESADGISGFVQADLTDAEQLREAFDDAVAQLGSLDILVNAAGVDETVPALEMSLDAWDAVHAVDLRAPFHLCQLAGRIFTTQESGKIINVGSLGSHVGYKNDSAYIAAKHGLMGLTRALALEWAARNVQVNLLAPGFISTDMTEEALENERVRKWVLRSTPMRRWGETKDVVGAAVFLASPASDYMTGQSLNVDGGWTAQ